MERILKLNYKKIFSFLIMAVLVVVAIFVSLRLAIFFLPFVIAYIIYKIIAKPINFFNKKLKFPRPLATIVCLLLFVGIIGGVGYLFLSTLINEVVSLSKTSNYFLPTMAANINEQLSRLNFFYNGLDLPPEIISGIQTSLTGIVNGLVSSLSNAINSFANFLVNAVMGLPNALIYIIITVLSTFFICNDSKFIRESLEKVVPKKWIEKVQSIVNDLFSALGGYLKAQGILMSITFIELFTAFSIYGFEYALILAISIAIIDALPILGTGTVLIPWAIVNLLTANYRLAIYLIILYLFVLVVRQLIEPKIVGTQIGIYPLLTLIAMYTGVQLIGVLGVIAGPIVLIILRNILREIFQKGVIKDLFEYQEEK